MLNYRKIQTIITLGILFFVILVAYHLPGIKLFIPSLFFAVYIL